HRRRRRIVALDERVERPPDAVGPVKGEHELLCSLEAREARCLSLLVRVLGIDPVDRGLRVRVRDAERLGLLEERIDALREEILRSRPLYGGFTLLTRPASRSSGARASACSLAVGAAYPHGR